MEHNFPHDKSVWDWDIDPAFKVEDFFSSQEFKAGERIEYPLDKEEPALEYTAEKVGNAIQLSHQDPCYVRVGTYEVGAEGDTEAEVIDEINRKIRVQAALVLYFAAMDKNELTPVEDIVKLKHFRFGDYTIGVSGDPKTFCVIPIREKSQAFQVVKHPSYKGKPWYGWATVGTAVLSNKKVVIAWNQQK